MTVLTKAEFKLLDALDATIGYIQPLADLKPATRALAKRMVARGLISKRGLHKGKVYVTQRGNRAWEAQYANGEETLAMTDPRMTDQAPELLPNERDRIARIIYDAELARENKPPIPDGSWEKIKPLARFHFAAADAILTRPTPSERPVAQVREARDEQIQAALEWALEWMRKHNVDGLSPFKDYPPIRQTIAGMYQAMISVPPTLASERVSERETMTSVPADRVIGELPSEAVAEIARLRNELAMAKDGLREFVEAYKHQDCASYQDEMARAYGIADANLSLPS